MCPKDELVKTEFDFGYTEWKEVPEAAKLALEHQKGDVLDVGCSTCQLANYFRQKGWGGKYYGIDVLRHEGVVYPENIDLIVGDATRLEFPQVDTVILYDILEHVEDPSALLKKGLKAARNNVLIKVPLRNEELWEHGVVETHQKDRSHKHAGFSREEVARLVELCESRIVAAKDLEKIDATSSVNLWHGSFPKKITYLMSKMFSSKTYYAGYWCEVVRASR